MGGLGDGSRPCFVVTLPLPTGATSVASPQVSCVTRSTPMRCGRSSPCRALPSFVHRLRVPFVACLWYEHFRFHPPQPRLQPVNPEVVLPPNVSDPNERMDRFHRRWTKQGCESGTNVHMERRKRRRRGPWWEWAWPSFGSEDKLTCSNDQKAMGSSVRPTTSPMIRSS